MSLIKINAIAKAAKAMIHLYSYFKFQCSSLPALNQFANIWLLWNLCMYMNCICMAKNQHHIKLWLNSGMDGLLHVVFECFIPSHKEELMVFLKRTYNEVLCLCHIDLAENQVGLPLVDPVWLQATPPVSQLSFCDINKVLRYKFSLGCLQIQFLYN